MEKAADDWVAMYDLAEPSAVNIEVKRQVADLRGATEPIDALELWWELDTRDPDEPRRWGEAA
jgi:hypothetical protein